MTVAKIAGSGAAAYGQYLEGRTVAAEAGDYYLADGERVEAPGRWVLGACPKRVRPTGLRPFGYGYGFSEGSGSDGADRDGLLG